MAFDRADDLYDFALEEEITLLGRVMDAVGDVTRQLKTAEVDRALGVRQCASGGKGLTGSRGVE